MIKKKEKYTGNCWKYKLILISLITITSCEWLQIKNNGGLDEGAIPIARVEAKYLYYKDIEGIVPKGTNAVDSTSMANRYVQNWIKKQLMINEASSKIDFNKAELERKILDYQYALMAYEFEKQHVFANLNKEVTPKEISQYYQTHKENFQLKQNILRCIFMQIPKDSPKLKDIKKALSGKSESAKAQLKSLSLRYATKTHLEDTIWLKFDDVFRSVPLEVTNRVQFLKDNRNRIIEVVDENYVYLVNIIEYKIKDEISPLDYVKEDIKTIIINKRKTMLARQLEDDIYNKALKDKNFEIYVEN